MRLTRAGDEAWTWPVGTGRGRVEEAGSESPTSHYTIPSIACRIISHSEDPRHGRVASLASLIYRQHERIFGTQTGGVSAVSQWKGREEGAAMVQAAPERGSGLGSQPHPT
ncbi:hypothetical protein CPLU01_06622 [Colletotrichum plurivorum]|uniref:Uncharacterized protein n=1 Tax=Colletotrichum plurivorum TaxID=2175906 RepID=A0A8H6NFJ7_9PEZI|nr:hypothetical protein CPLU01_06622 [Colletotrichum plurivorum]